MLFLLLNVVFLHHLPEIVTKLNLDLHLEQFSNHALVSIVVLILPIILPLLAQTTIKLLIATNKKPKSPKFIELAYGYLPLVLAGNLAHYLHLGLTEGGRILPVTLVTFGWQSQNLPIFVAHPAVIAFLQGTTLFFGVLLSIALTQKIARQSFKLLLPQHLVTIFLAIAMGQIIVST